MKKFLFIILSLSLITVFSTCDQDDPVDPDKPAAPAFDPSGGDYPPMNLSIAITSTTDTADIHYTDDGSDPTASSALYTNAVSISETTILKAIAVDEDGTESNISESIYTMSAGEGVAVSGTITFNDILIHTLTDVEPSIYVKNEAEISITDEVMFFYDKNSSSFGIGNLPEESVQIQIQFLPEGAGSWMYPGSYAETVNYDLVSMTENERLNVSFPLFVAIHLTVPFDNTGYNSSTFTTYSSPLIFTWDEVAGSVYYNVIIYEYHTDTYGRDEIVNENMSTNTYQATLPVSSAECNYEFIITVYSDDDEDLSEFWVFGDGFRWYYPFYIE